MTVVINNREVEVPQSCTRLSQLLEAENLCAPGTAVAVAGRVVPRATWGEFEITEGMNLTVIRAVCGG